MASAAITAKSIVAVAKPGSAAVFAAFAHDRRSSAQTAFEVFYIFSCIFKINYNLTFFILFIKQALNLIKFDYIS